ncbi:MAG: sodium:proton antiporter [Methyloprofundus sp.]|nr:sodium:proton antiporter [Methyloprofundus sp.]
MNLEVFLSLFTLMLVSLLVYILAQKTKVPYTVLLVLTGSLLVPLSNTEMFGFISSFELTPELLFFVFLPILIFESAYNIQVSDMRENIRTISLLAIVGLLISTVFIGVVGHYVFRWIGLDIPIIVMLLFGAIISATDPVAVLSLFKEYGAPRRLTLIFEGESLLNDGTAFALFLVFLEVIRHGYLGASSVIDGFITFFSMVVGGILFGLMMGFIFSKLIEWVKGHEHLEITLTLLVAHFTFILSEVLSEHVVVLGYHLHFSSIIATLIASMVIGNYGRFKMSVAVEEYMEKFWGYFGFVTNSLVFILMGFLFVEQSMDLHIAILPILLSIIVVMLGRALSIYPVLGLVNLAKKEEPIPVSWMHLLSWGSLRGALAVIMVLLIPDNLTVDGWQYAFSIKEFVSAITIGCIYFTLLVKATTIGGVMHYLGIDALTSHEELSYHKSKVLIYGEGMQLIEKLLKAGKINPQQYQSLSEQYNKLHRESLNDYKKKTRNTKQLTSDLLRIYILGLEKEELKLLYAQSAINEKIYKKILYMLDIQMQRIERHQAQLNNIDEVFPVDGLESLINVLRKLLFLGDSHLSPEDTYVYYRTQYKLILTAIRSLRTLPESGLIEVFDDQDDINKITALYLSLKQGTEQKLEEMLANNYELLHAFNALSARKALGAQEITMLDQLNKNEIITSKLYIMLRKELLDE